jgi:glycerol-3-phosphate O-acyltransferase
VRDEQRNFEYTKILGSKIVSSYFENNTVMTAPLVAFVYFIQLKKRHKHLSLFEIMLLPREDRIVSRDNMIAGMATIIVKLKDLEKLNKVNLSEIIKESTIDNVLANGMNSISLFNSKKVVYADSDGNINSQDVRLAYFYHNRLIGYNLEEYL